MSELYMPKTVWLVSPSPTGRFKSFAHRGWPMAQFHSKDGPCAARVMPILVEHKSYRPDLKEVAPLQVGVADYRGGDGFVWRKLALGVTGFSEAKHLWESWLYDNLEKWVIPS